MRADLFSQLGVDGLGDDSVWGFDMRETNFWMVFRDGALIRELRLLWYFWNKLSTCIGNGRTVVSAPSQHADGPMKPTKELQNPETKPTRDTATSARQRHSCPTRRENQFVSGFYPRNLQNDHCVNGELTDVQKYTPTKRPTISLHSAANVTSKFFSVFLHSMGSEGCSWNTRSMTNSRWVQKAPRPQLQFCGVENTGYAALRGSCPPPSRNYLQGPYTPVPMNLGAGKVCSYLCKLTSHFW